MKKRNNKDTKLKKAFRNWIGRSVCLLIELYGLGGITVVFHEETKDEKTKQGITGFRMNYSVPYKTANIWYYPYFLDLFKKKDFAILRQGLTHEIAHVLTNPLGDLAHERYATKREIEIAVETLTESIGQLCRSLMKAKGIEMV